MPETGSYAHVPERYLLPEEKRRGNQVYDWKTLKQDWLRGTWQTVTQMSKETGISRGVIQNRMKTYDWGQAKIEHVAAVSDVVDTEMARLESGEITFDKLAAGDYRRYYFFLREMVATTAMSDKQRADVLLKLSQFTEPYFQAEDRGRDDEPCTPEEVQEILHLAKVYNEIDDPLIAEVVAALPDSQEATD